MPICSCCHKHIDESDNDLDKDSPVSPEPTNAFKNVYWCKYCKKYVELVDKLEQLDRWMY